MQFKKLLPGVVHITFPTAVDAAGSLIRFQEHYESPHPEIRGQVFTLGQVRAKGSRSSGLNTYEGGNTYATDWGGYNFPDYVLEPFNSGLFDPLTPAEADLVKTLRHLPKPFYVIGTSDDFEGAITHEVAHALYYTNAKYKAAVDKILSQYKLGGLKKVLLAAGYSKEVLQDECHAYLGPDYHTYLDTFSHHTARINAMVPESVHIELMKNLRKYYKLC